MPHFNQPKKDKKGKKSRDSVKVGMTAVATESLEVEGWGVSP
jgi:hypothetical protein